MPSDRLVVHDGEVYDDAVGPVPIDDHQPVCNTCQTPGDVIRAFNGEYYCPECRPDYLKP